MEAAFCIPFLLFMLFGIYDVGNAITVNHKMITASSVLADLITRGQSVSTSELNDAIIAAGLAMNPYTDSDGIGVDIISVSYDADDDPVQLWRETRNMAVDADAIDRMVGLGTEGEGAVMVTITYRYIPTFGNIVIPEVGMKETAFARGRRSATVSRE